MATITELQSEFNTLDVEKTQISAQIASIANETAPIEQQIATLRTQAQELDLKISETPPSVGQKSCSCAFLCMGKTCSEFQVPNPAINDLINQRNPLIRQSNDLQAQIDAKGKQIGDLTTRQVEIETRQNEIRGLLVAEKQALLPAEGKVSPAMMETLKKYLPYILIGGGVLTLVLVIVRRR